LGAGRGADGAASGHANGHLRLAECKHGGVRVREPSGMICNLMGESLVVESPGLQSRPEGSDCADKGIVSARAGDAVRGIFLRCQRVSGGV
jgi:hypothetical protein